MTIALVVGIFVVITGIFVATYLHRRSETFDGEVVDKDVQEVVENSNYNQPSRGMTFSLSGNNNQGGVTHTYMVKIKTATGDTKSWQVSQGMYEVINIGDHVVKPSGTTTLQVTAKAQQQAAQPASTPPAPTSQP
jgi:hypothetical protein